MEALDKSAKGTMKQAVESDDKKARLAKYNAVVDAAELADIFLQSSQFEIQPEYFKAQREAETGEGSGPKLSIESSIEDVAFVDEDGLVGANFIWQVKAKQSRKQLLKCRCVIVCYYIGLKGQEEEAVIAFIKKVGRFATYPYFRNYMSQISWSSGAELPILPVLREQKPRKKSGRKRSAKESADV